MAGVGTTNISLNSLRTAWGNAGYAGGSDPGSTNISLSEFYNATFTNGTTAPSSGEISINDDFKGKTFGTSSIVYNTGSFRVYDNWSAYSTKLKGTTGSSTFTGSTTANKRAKLYSSHSSSYPYSIILLTPNATNSSTSPGIIVDRSNSNAVDEVTVWFRVVSHNGYNQVQMGIVAKDMTLNNWSTQKSYLHNKHSTYCDRLCFHGAGYHNYAGSRDDITSSSTIVSPQYKSGTYGSNLTTNFHNRTGATGGTMRSYNAASAPSGGFNMYFFKNSYYNYSDYRGSSKNPNHGLKIKWYETTLQVKLESGSSTILPVSSNWTASNLTDIFSGMYVSGTGIPTGQGAFIGEIHTNYMVLYKGKGTTSLTELDASSTQSSTTLTISGYLYWTLTTGHDSSNSNTNYVNPKIMGPPHTVLPKYQAASNGSTSSVEIDEWAFFIGDTAGATNNYFDYDLRNTDPGGTAFSYSVTYGSGTVPSAATYEFGMKNTAGSYTIYESNASTVSSITPSGSGYNHTGMANNNINWRYYSMGLKWKIINAGKIVGVGVNARYGGHISVFINNSNTAASGGSNIDVNGNSLTSNTINYKYTLLANPISVSANDIVQIIFKNTTGGYCWHYVSAFDYVNTSSGNLQVQGAGYKSTGNTVTTPSRPTNNLIYGYGATDLIFLPD